jgi:hypothetical protein
MPDLQPRALPQAGPAAFLRGRVLLLECWHIEYQDARDAFGTKQNRSAPWEDL